jgi:hypothetical protein
MQALERHIVSCNTFFMLHKNIKLQNRATKVQKSFLQSQVGNNGQVIAEVALDNGHLGNFKLLAWEYIINTEGW